MPIITGLLILLIFQCTGEAIKAYFDLPLPGPVVGMLLLFVCLCCYRGIPSMIDKASQTLITHLTLMFLPAAVGLLFLGPRFDDQWTAILAAIVIGSVLSLLFNGLMMKWLCRKSDLSEPR